MLSHTLGKTNIRIKNKKGNWVSQDAFLDPLAIQSMISANLAKKLGVKIEIEDSTEIQKCGFIEVEAMIQGHWIKLRDEACSNTVLVWWVVGHSMSGVCFSKSVLDNTKLTTIVEEEEEEEKEDN